MKNGYIQIYTGNGKGKTTAAIGVIMRSLAHGYKVYLGQFLKLGEYNEIKALKKFGKNNIVIEQYGCGDELSHIDENLYKKYAENGLSKAIQAIKSNKFDLIVLDEINIALHFNYITNNDVLKIMELKNKNTELIFTGRYANNSIIEKADLVTEMKEIKHYYKNGVIARAGIEL